MSDQSNTITVDPTADREWLRVVRELGGRHLELMQRGARYGAGTKPLTLPAAPGQAPRAGVHLPSCAIVAQLGRDRGSHIKQLPPRAMDDEQR